MSITPPYPEITLDVRNLSTVVTDAELSKAFAAFIQQVNGDLHTQWLRTPFVNACRELPSDQAWADDARFWRASIYDSPFQALTDASSQGMPIQALPCLGFNFPDPLLQPDEAVPHLVVFAGVALQVGVAWTVTFSHELLEALTNPTGVLVVEVPAGGDVYDLAVCDPVQYLSYPIYPADDVPTEAVWVSDFVTPSWFSDPGSPGDAPFDFANQLVRPLQVAVGGELTLVAEDRTQPALVPVGPLPNVPAPKQWTTLLSPSGTRGLPAEG